METALLDRTLIKVYQRFPEFRGSKPRIKRQPIQHGNSAESSHNYVMTFSKSVKTSDDQIMQRSLRVVVSSNGKIIKISTTK